MITQRKPITPPDDFKRNPVGDVPPLCDITGDLEEVTNAVWVRAVDAAINALLATQDRYCRTIVKFTAHSLSLPFYSLGMRTPHNLPPTWAPDKNGSGCSNLKEGVNISGKPSIWAAQPLQLPICISWELVPQPWKSDLCIFCIAWICFYFSPFWDLFLQTGIAVSSSKHPNLLDNAQTSNHTLIHLPNLTLDKMACACSWLMRA